MADATAAREQAREILGQDRFQETDLPRPFEEPLEWIGDRLTDVGDWFDGAFDDVDGSVPGGELVVWGLLGIVVIVIALLAARGVIRRRATAAYGRGDHGRADRPVDPTELEREADAAEREGDYDRAVRLRFAAGVLRLERGAVLDAEVLRTTGEIGAALRSAEYDELGADFDEIAYGGRPASASDAAEAREGWAAVLEESRRS